MRLRYRRSKSYETCDAVKKIERNITKCEEKVLQTGEKRGSAKEMEGETNEDPEMRIR